MAALLPPAIAAALAEEIPKIFEDALNRARDGGPSTIKDGEPTSIVGQLGQASARSACRRYGANPDSFPSGRVQRIEAACRPYLDTISSGKGPTFRTLFQGGQCDENYTAQVQTTRTDLGTSETSPDVSIRGPMAIRARKVDESTFAIEINTRAWWFSSASQPETGAQIWRTYSTITVVSGTSVRVVLLGLQSLNPGITDDCGNPDPTTEPGIGIPDPTGPSFRFNPSADIDIPIGIEINPDGTIAVDIGTGPITIDPFPGGGGGGGGEDAPGDVGEPDEEAAQDADGDGNASGCAGENQTIGGLKIDIVTVPTKANTYSPGIFRGAAYIWMGVEGNLDQDFGGSMLRSGQFFLPEKDNLTCWEVQANIGFKLRVTPYYKTEEETA